MPALLTPWALLGLLSLPVLFGIYWLKRRSQRQVVSSLTFWLVSSPTRQGGMRWQSLQTPWLFWLELFILVLASLAAAGPMFERRSTQRPLTVVLDDSYSMRAGSPPAQELAWQALLEEVDRGGRRPIRFIRAGMETTSLGEPVYSKLEVSPIFERWTCQSPRSDLSSALTLARQVSPTGARILILTDRQPESDLISEGVVVWSFGLPISNLAFTKALRAESESRDGLYVGVSNLGPSPVSSSFQIRSGDRTESVAFTIQGMTTRPFRLGLEGKRAVDLTLPPDALDFDNSLRLLPETRAPVRVLLDLRSPGLKELFRTTLEAIPEALIVNSNADLAITDQPLDRPIWTLYVKNRPAKTWSGPFAVDHSHPLGVGLSLRGTIWGGPPQKASGLPIVTNEKTTLLKVTESDLGIPKIDLSFDPNSSTLQRSPDWPILLWNAIRWRQHHLAGATRANLALGEDLLVGIPVGTEKAIVILPDGTRFEAPREDSQLRLSAQQQGVYQVQVQGWESRVAVNALNATESNLTIRSRGKWGTWIDDLGAHWEFWDASPLLVLAALSLLAFHFILISSGRRDETP